MVCLVFCVSSESIQVVSHHWAKHKEVVRGRAGVYLSSGATGTQTIGLRDLQGPGKELLGAAAKDTGPGGACQERPVRRQTLLGEGCPEPPERGPGHSPRAFLLRVFPRIVQVQNSTYCGRFHPNATEPE